MSIASARGYCGEIEDFLGEFTQSIGIDLYFFALV